MKLGLERRVALVAASSRGLGRATAAELAAEGASVIMCARNETELARAAEQIGDASGSRVVPVAGDLSEPDDVQRIVATGVAALGPVDILVTNTGGPPAGSPGRRGG